MRRGLGVMDRLDRLRHEAVIRRDDEHDDIGHIRAARAHGGKGGVAGGVEKSDAGPFVIDRVSADVLGDAAGFARRDARLADRVHERGLAMVDVAHERDDRRAQLELFFLFDDRRRRRDHHLLDLVHAAAFFAAFHLEDEAVLLANFRRHFGFHRQVGIRENVEVVHQLADELEILQPELRREILDDDRRLDVNDLAAVLGFGLDFGVGRAGWSGGRYFNRRLARRLWRSRGRTDAGNRRKNGALDRVVGRNALRFRGVRINQRNAFHDRLRRFRCRQQLGRAWPVVFSP